MEIKDTIHMEHGAVSMIAHRGVSGLEKENTAAAFIAAGNRSYFGIETDIHMTADGGFILIHNDTTEESCGIALTVEQTTYDALRALPVRDRDGSFDRRDLCLPNLSEYIAICKRYGKRAVLELKNPMPETAIATIVQQIRAMEYLTDVIFISFCWDNLLHLRACCPEAAAQYLVGDWEEGLPGRLREYRIDLDCYYRLLDPQRMAELRAAGVRVNVWTVDDPEQARALIELGVDMITTNILE